MIVIVEGPRGAGKTTIVSALDHALKSIGHQTVVWKAKREGDPHLHMVNFVKAASPDLFYLVDRFHLTEYVMSSHFGRRPSFELLSSTLMIERALQSVKAVGVILDASDTTLDTRVINRSDGRGFEMPVDRSRFWWRQAAKLSFMPVVATDAVGFSVSEFAEDMAESLTEEEISA